MIRKLLVLLVFLSMAAACNNSQKNAANKSNDGMDTIQEPVIITVSDYLSKADELVGREIKVQGTVSHTCRNGGKKMFIFDDNEDNRLKIDASESVPIFDVSLEGSDVLVSGVMTELIIDEAYLAEWEQEIKSEMENPNQESDTAAMVLHEGSGLGEAADQGTHVSALESIENYRKQIKESGKDHLSFYSVECTSYEVLPSDTLK
jgi:hypothetical protein